MSTFVEEKLKEILVSELELEEVTLNLNDKFEHLGVNSAVFIKFVVKLEDAFDIEFDDDNLDYDNFQTIADIIRYIEQKMEENEV